MTISAEIICDSISLHGKRITTFVIRYPRWLHPEIMTHRALSRNASSSRAIPIRKLSRDILDDTSYPISFRSNKSGMQGGDELPPWRQVACRAVWKFGALVSVALARILAALGAAKETANRLQEAYGHISVVVTATEWSNFFALRYHAMAQPEFRHLAKLMWEAYQMHTPNQLVAGEWHLPFVGTQEADRHLLPGWHLCPDPSVMRPRPTDLESWQPLINRSIARCARVSYLNHMNGVPTQAEDDKLCQRLIGSQPIHASPAEHQATPDKPGWWSGNFDGWVQYRKTLPNENITDFKGP